MRNQRPFSIIQFSTCFAHRAACTHRQHCCCTQPCTGPPTRGTFLQRLSAGQLVSPAASNRVQPMLWLGLRVMVTTLRALKILPLFRSTVIIMSPPSIAKKSAYNLVYLSFSDFLKLVLPHFTILIKLLSVRDTSLLRRYSILHCTSFGTWSFRMGTQPTRPIQI